MKNSLTIEWLGTAGFRFSYLNEIILLDPYITRIHNRTTPIIPDDNKLKNYIPKADYIIVSHSHYDHFADVPNIAKYTEAAVIGSQTTINACRSFEVKENLLNNVNETRHYSSSNFEVSFIQSLHGLNSCGEVPFKGTFDFPPVPPPSIASDFLEGGTFAPVFNFDNIKVLQIGSANFIKENLTNCNVDILLLCIAWREKVPNFLKDILECTSPKVIIPMHFDDYLNPIEEGLVYREDTSLKDFLQEVKELDYSGEIVVLDFFEKYEYSE